MARKGRVGSNPTPARELGSFDPSLLFPTPLAIFGEVFYIRTAEVGDSGLTPVMKFKFTQQSLPNHRGRQPLLNIQHDIKIEEPFRTFMRITLKNTNYSNNQTEKKREFAGDVSTGLTFSQIFALNNSYRVYSEIFYQNLPIKETAYELLFMKKKGC